MSEDKRKIFFEASSTSSEQKLVDELLLEAGISKRGKRDFYIAYYAVTEGKNGNNAIFTKDELESSHESFRGTQVNWNHESTEFCGTNIYTKMTTYKGKSAILVLAKFTRGYPAYEYVREIEERHMGGTLRFSMECWYDTVTCEKCSEKFSMSDSWCEHLYNGAGRILGGVEFMGSGVVVNPADKNAKSIALAKEEKDKEKSMEFEKMYNEVKQEFEKAKLESTSKVETLEAEIAKLKEEKEAKDIEIKEIASKVEAIESEKLEIAKEKETIESNLLEETKKRVSLERANKLAEIGINAEEIKERFNFEEASEKEFDIFIVGYQEFSSNFKQKKQGISGEAEIEEEKLETAKEIENKEIEKETEFSKIFKNLK